MQAGGACGVWPYRLAQEFAKVYTFEPEAGNYRCLLENLEGVTNVSAFPLALSDGQHRQGAMSLHPSENGNCGAWYFDPGGSGFVQSITIDSLDLLHCDLIQLDVEGHELAALTGAVRTLKRCRPTVVIEEKPLPQNIGLDVRRAREFLESLGYREVGAIHRDVIFRC